MKFVDNPKYNQIIETASELFVRFGIKRVTVEEICKTSGVSKMTFYKFFRNKNEVVEKILDEMIGHARIIAPVPAARVTREATSRLFATSPRSLN